ncbi:MAG TPA: hypothetical protein VIJ75_10525 [Hanamia sp.]
MSGIWKGLTHQPTFNASTMLLLTDGTIMCQESGGLNWHRLTPDSGGNYINGTWSALAPMINTRLYFASAVLRDGRVIVCGGEYSNAGGDTNKCEIYNPLTDTWTAIAAPAGWTNVGDAACCVLPDGRFLMGYYNGNKTAIFDPATNTWNAGPNKGDSASEETWTLLPDETVLAAQCVNHPNSEKYVIAANNWVTAGTIPVDLVEASSIEIGPACLMPDGRVFCVGATGKTAIYTPPVVSSAAGTWTTGPDIPKVGGVTIGAKDAPGCLMPNGKVLFVGGPVDGVSGDYLSPTYFYEFDGRSIYRVPDPANSGSVPFAGRMMLTPSGQVLFANGSNSIYCYVPDGYPDESWRPAITNIPYFVRHGQSYTLQGRQINGLSQAVAYGDDVSSATNYPIVKLTNISTGKVYFCKTFDHSTMGVNTGTTIHSTNFYVPSGVPLGSYEITLIANGISSYSHYIYIWDIFWWPPYIKVFEQYEIWNQLIGSLADGPLWVLGPNGPIPVDPWGPKYARQANEARTMVLNGIRELQKLGSEIHEQRIKQSELVSPAVDDATKGDDNKGKKAKRKSLELSGKGV